MDYKRLFIQKELVALIGAKKRNLLICTSLLFIAVFTISLSLGAYEQLKERMDNPFTNWVTMPVLYQYRDNIPGLKDYFTSSSNLEKYNLKNISGYVKWTFKMIHPQKKTVKDITGRTLDFNEEIAIKIFEKENIVSIKEGFAVNDPENLFELFVTEEFCGEMNINARKSVGKQLIIKDFEENYIFLFTIGGVVKSLPNHTNFIMSQDFFNMFIEKYETTGFIEVGNQTRLSFISNKIPDENLIKQSLKPIDVIDIEQEDVSIVGIDNFKQITVFTSDFLQDSLIARFYKKMNLRGDSVLLQKVWKPVSGYSDLSEPMYVSFNFKTLDKIKELQLFLKNRFKMEIELSVVEERDNFSIVSRLTFFMILSLIIVSMISFSIFLFNLIRNHLDKIKPNIGTFMAFGFSRKVVEEIYIKTVIKFMLYSWVISGTNIFLFWIAGFFTGIYSLKFWHPVVILTFIMFNILSYFVTKLITTKILKETPGDLIYDRV